MAPRYCVIGLFHRLTDLLQQLRNRAAVFQHGASMRPASAAQLPARLIPIIDAVPRRTW
jgi:hypothetical protein